MRIWQHARFIAASLLIAASGCTGDGEIRKSQNASLTQAVGHAQIEIEVP